MKYRVGLMVVLTSCLTGCFQMKMQPIKVEPVRMTLDINVKLQQQGIESAAAEASPITSKIAPDFTLPNQNNKPITLSNFRGQWVVLYFYPEDGTTGCTLEAIEFTALLPRFRLMNTAILGVSQDSIQSHCDFIDDNGIELTLLSDPAHQVMEQYGAWVVTSFGDLSYGRAIRTTMIIDPQGVIRHFMPEVMPQGHAERVLEKLAELQEVGSLK